MRHGPQAVEHLEGHASLHVVLRQPADEGQQLLHVVNGAAPGALEARKQLLELLRLKVDGQLAQQIQHVVLNYLVLAHLRVHVTRHTAHITYHTSHITRRTTAGIRPASPT